jgi:hypothetical protein
MSTASALNCATSASHPAAALATRSSRWPQAASKCALATSIPAHGRAAVTDSLPCRFAFIRGQLFGLLGSGTRCQCALTSGSPASSRLRGITGLARIWHRQNQPRRAVDLWTMRLRRTGAARGQQKDVVHHRRLRPQAPQRPTTMKQDNYKREHTRDVAKREPAGVHDLRSPRVANSRPEI